ncbi:toll/interleukin-1 receptor domain-containing protein [Nannocystis pusilla]|uniref:Toll/interleukin-1 receptor domain-containing protein n=1 Tax=Nannocystis pusilla TaxID=889268 RepID=A0ABS7U1Z8_9BACT|nr:toll/interleukin-1 receptor domain-containing protein [Nannocystis pusilla]MBZ5714547.1 toll/interleukin-1 receptor domain-containing protein [Nannocystis pusilla]
MPDALRRFDRRRTFISYAVRDLPLSRAHLERLRASDEFVFLDYPQRWSTSAQRTIADWLRSADRVIYVATPHSRLSPWVRLELATARRLGVPIEQVVLPGTVAAVAACERPFRSRITAP